MPTVGIRLPCRGDHQLSRRLLRSLQAARGCTALPHPREGPLQARPHSTSFDRYVACDTRRAAVARQGLRRVAGVLEPVLCAAAAQSHVGSRHASPFARPALARQVHAGANAGLGHGVGRSVLLSGNCLDWQRREQRREQARISEGTGGSSGLFDLFAPRRDEPPPGATSHSFVSPPNRPPSSAAGSAYFGLASRRLFLPHTTIAERIDAAVDSMRGVEGMPIVGVHVRAMLTCKGAQEQRRPSLKV